MSQENKSGQFALDIESMIESRIQQQMASIKAAAYREAFTELLRQHANQVDFGDFLLNLNQQKQDFIDYVHRLPLSAIVGMASQDEPSGAQLRELQIANNQLQRERDQLQAELSRVRSVPAAKTTEDDGRSRRSSADLQEQTKLFRPQILSYLESKLPQTVGEIARALGVDSEDLRRPIQELLSEGRLQKEGEKRATRYALVGLTS